MLMRVPVMSVVPTSAAGMYHQGGETHPSNQQGPHLFMGHNQTGAMQPHPVTANPGAPHHPGQPPTPQNHSNAPLPAMGAQPPAQQAIMYSSTAQGGLPQHHVAAQQAQYPPGAPHAPGQTPQLFMFPSHHLHQVMPQGHTGAAPQTYPSTSTGAAMQPHVHPFSLPGRDAAPVYRIK